MSDQDAGADPIRVMVVDDHPIWRDGVRGDLERSGTATVVAEASDGGEAIELARETTPEVVLMDLQMPAISGVEAIRRIVDESPQVKILVLSASGEEVDVLEAVKVGATGYLLKSSTSWEIADAVRRARDGEPVFTPSLAGLVLAEFRRVATKGPAPSALTPGESDVLKLVAKGYTYREIAEKLSIRAGLVRHIMQGVLTQLHCMHVTLDDEELVGAPAEPGSDRVLITVLLADIVGSTETAARIGDRGWRDLLEAFRGVAKRELTRFGGRQVDTAGDGFLAAFEPPAQAIRCACAIKDSVRGLGIQIRVGIHTGECERVGDKVRGIAVHIGARVAAEAAPDDILVSRTVRDLVTGSGIRFEERGSRVLKGVPGMWELFAVER